MSSIPVAPPPPPPPRPSAGNIKPSPSSPPPPPPPPPRTPRRTTDTSTPTTTSRQRQLPLQPKLSASSDDLASLDALIDTEVDDTHSELVTSSVSATSPSADIDEYEFPSTSAKPVSPLQESTVVTPSPLHPADDDDLPNEKLAPFQAILQKSEGVLSTSSMASSPRRPRRAGTAIPRKARTSEFDFEVSDDIGLSARDEFEEEFLSRNAGDRESQMINDVLERVDFRQLSDDEEVLSDDATDTSRREPAAHRANERPDQTKPRRREAKMHSVHLDRIRQATMHPKLQHVPSEVGCMGCEGCDRLCGENRKLRRQLDELEFELASGVLQNSPDDFDPDDVVRTIPTMPQVPSMSKKKKGWTNKLLNATTLSVSSSKPGERARLKAEVQALSVTTEYLWRKLNKAENELRNYRLKDLRNRMKLSAIEQKRIDHHSPEPQARYLDLVGTNDWDWE